MLMTEWKLEEALVVEREEGREEGREQGFEEGRKEIAKAALAKGMSPETVSEITGLDIETVKKLTGR
jgi:predicted transposase/invertase (TIGR01784 family)